jgi:hypothetical protein
MMFSVQRSEGTTPDFRAGVIVLQIDADPIKAIAAPS